MYFGGHLVAEAGGHLHQFHATVLAALAQPFQRTFDAARWCRLIFREQVLQLGQGERLAGGQQRTFDNAVDQRLIHRQSALTRFHWRRRCRRIRC
ncbi:hypothetical protein D3C80_1994560 [compost metagenome]